jgi:prepilin-type N-terminal cleavage/methylation domain-containing protein
MSPRSHRLGNAGFTLIELLVTTIISFALGAGGVLFFRTQVRALADQSAGLDATEGARSALDFMASEIRRAGTNTGLGWALPANYCGAGLSQSSSANTLTIVWDGQAAITYDLNNGQIRRTVDGEAAQTLIKNAVGLSFQYLKQDNSAATWPGQCTSVTTILLNVQVQTPRAPSTSTVTFASRIALRNNSKVLGRLTTR